MSDDATDFEFGGRLALDLTWTLRYRDVAPTELLARPSDLRRWLTRAVAPVRVPVDDVDLDEAVGLREAIYGAARAVIDGRLVDRSGRSTINGWAARPGPVAQLGPEGRLRRRLRPGAEIESAFAAIAADAVDLLVGSDGRLRLCEGPGCSLVFHDGSRPGRRRWCSTERCGNRVNTARYRRRQAGDLPDR